MPHSAIKWLLSSAGQKDSLIFWKYKRKYCGFFNFPVIRQFFIVPATLTAAAVSFESSSREIINGGIR